MLLTCVPKQFHQIDPVHDIREQISYHGIRLLGSQDFEPFSLPVGKLLGKECTILGESDLIPEFDFPVSAHQVQGELLEREDQFQLARFSFSHDLDSLTPTLTRKASFTSDTAS